ncbi:MAG: pyruvate dehydrogenase (acetyl-transferring) E1 component subunit alpha [Dehalococcoidales bacterium]|nr:pyruvate dehydrogenase (acetyl-transferring) E1 component subunit alpha [Dehalococcoidales bacterium]
MDLKTTVTEEEKRGLLSQRDEMLHLYYLMLLVRKFEEKAAEMYTRAKVGGFVHLNIGEEATVVGAMSAAGPRDYVFTSYREHGYIIARGEDPNLVMAELYGKITGTSKGRGGSMHLFDAERHFMGGYAIVGGHLPLAVGSALAADYRQSDAATICVFGDGATNIGSFHESLNLAKVWHLPIVFFCVNNQYGMGTAVARASAVTEIYKKAAAYDMPGERVNGMDVLAVREATRRALERARRDREPTLIESLTYRYRGHSMSDPGRYRSEEEVRTWRERDPIGNFQHRLLEAGAVDEDALREIDQRAADTVQRATDFADQSASPDPATDLYRYLYADTKEG